MLNEYKPTQDPNLDTFKVEYLLGGAAVLAIVFPREYSIMEVRTLILFWTLETHLTNKDIVVLFHLARGGRNSAPTFHATAHRGS